MARRFGGTAALSAPERLTWPEMARVVWVGAAARAMNEAVNWLLHPDSGPVLMGAEVRVVDRCQSGPLRHGCWRKSTSTDLGPDARGELSPRLADFADLRRRLERLTHGAYLEAGNSSG